MLNWWRRRRNPPIFVFGSNQHGWHAGGAAAHAVEEYGAEWNVGEGRTGNAYALPTLDHNWRQRHLWQIRDSVDLFIDYANAHQELTFLVTKVGCGIAGFDEADIAPMFDKAPKNCVLPDGWRDWSHLE
jgi:hypothetical protein